MPLVIAGRQSAVEVGPLEVVEVNFLSISAGPIGCGPADQLGLGHAPEHQDRHQEYSRHGSMLADRRRQSESPLCVGVVDELLVEGLSGSALSTGESALVPDRERGATNG